MGTTTHFFKRLALAHGAFAAVKSLSPTGRGLAPYMCHRLASGLIFPILSYGGDGFRPSKSALGRLLVFWNKVFRWVTNCFHSTLVATLPYEAALAPLPLLLDHKRRLAALRLACSSPLINPAAARLPPSLSIHDCSPVRSSNRALLRGLLVNYIPLNWEQPKFARAPRRHLPIDELCHSLLSLSRLIPVFPIAAPHFLPGDILLPYSPPSRYPALRKYLREQLPVEWARLHPTHQEYPYSAALTPYAFMGLDQFTAGCIHQIPSGKSDLAAHTLWDEPLAPISCPSCDDGKRPLITLSSSAPLRPQLRNFISLRLTILDQRLPSALPRT